MKKSNLQQAIDKETLLGKSKVYIQRALRCKDENDLDQYQLWASLAIELLGKAALSAIHPSLIVDPNHYQSLFAASGINLSSDIKTIKATTLFNRLARLSPEFDKNVRKFCDAISQRRNAELHSGETPFQAMRLEAWERQYWYAAQLVLTMSESSLDEWLGADQAKAPKQIVEQAREATKASVRLRIEYAARDFKEQNKSEREQALTTAKSKSATDYASLFLLVGDAEWEAKCPACEGKAFMTGMQYEEVLLDTTYDEEGLWETVERTFVAEEFCCPVCKLQLISEAEIKAADLVVEHNEIVEREAQYEPEYEND